jgi:F0F1-type ATP synthase assembly protein I
MPFHRPIPEDKSSNNVDAADSPKMAAPMKSLAQAESVMQIAFVMPCALVVGWGMGWCVDHFFHVHWAIAVGLVLGVIAGMVSAIRMAIQAMNTLGKPRGPK